MTDNKQVLVDFLYGPGQTRPESFEELNDTVVNVVKQLCDELEERKQWLAKRHRVHDAVLMGRSRTMILSMASTLCGPPSDLPSSETNQL